MVEIPIDIVVKKGLVYGEEVRVARLAGDKAKGRARYVIYLPTPRNYLWGELWKRKTVLRLWIEIVIRRMKASLNVIFKSN